MDLLPEDTEVEGAEETLAVGATHPGGGAGAITSEVVAEGDQTTEEEILDPRVAEISTISNESQTATGRLQ